jgi:penicillin-binding protein 1A
VIPAVAAAAILVSGPEIPALPPIKRDPQITYVDRSGQVLGVRGGRYSPPVDLARLPAYVPAAFVSVEDRRFYEHAAVDPLGIARALMTDLTQGRAAQGASTITQQLARNLFLNNDKTMERKATEVVYAMELEQKFTKQQILGLYLSRVYFGSGVYGIEDAAERFFNKPASQLTLKEAAMLAGVVRSPAFYDPAEQPVHAEERAGVVLEAMVQTRAVTAGERAAAMAEQPRIWAEAPNAPAQYFLDWLDGQTRRVVGTQRQDITVETTLDKTMELDAGRAAAAAVASHARQGIGQAAVISVDGQGHVRAFVGGVDYATSPFDRAVDAHRQAGSSWKPFVYLAALEAGRTPDTVVGDEPVQIGNWSPRDFEEGYLGPITLQQALAKSINTVAARLADEVGRDVVAADAHRLGIVSQINTDPAMALGTTLVTPLEMAQAYAALSNGGYRVQAYGIERIRTNGGQVLYQHRNPGQPQVAANPPLSELVGMMRTVVTEGTGTRAAVSGYDIAGKTGTTSDFRDAWFCGFTGNFTTVVWMGRDDDAPMRGVTGGSAPAELWHAYMRAALPRAGAQAIPPGPPAPPPPPIPVSTDATTPPTDAGPAEPQ